MLIQLPTVKSRLALTVTDYGGLLDRKSTRLNSSHRTISYAVFCLKKKTLSSYGGFRSVRVDTPHPRRDDARLPRSEDRAALDGRPRVRARRPRTGLVRRDPYTLHA